MLGFSPLSATPLASSFNTEIIIQPVVPQEVTGGGTWPGYVKRKRSVKEDREELGIVPKEVKNAIKAVVKDNLGYGSEDRAKEELKIELQRRDIAYKKNYAVALEAYRDQMVALEIYRLMKIKQAADDQDEEEAAIMLLM